MSGPSVEHRDMWCVYRLYDHEGALMYIGSTCWRERRMRQHRQRSAWAYDMTERELRETAMVVYEEHPDQWAALIAEAEAIRDEHPRHNVDRPNPDSLRALRAEQVSA